MRLANAACHKVPRCSTPILRSKNLLQVEELAATLRKAGVRVKTDTRDHQTPGWKYNYWELKVRSLVDSRIDMASEALRCAPEDYMSGWRCCSWELTSQDRLWQPERMSLVTQ